MHHPKANFHLDPEFEAEFFAAARLDPHDPETQKGKFVGEKAILDVRAAMLDKHISTDVAFEIAKLPTNQQKSRLHLYLTCDAGRFKADYERECNSRVVASMCGDVPKIEPVGVKRGEITAPTSVTIPLSIEDIAEIRSLRTEVGIATDADYIIEALRMMRFAISFGKLGYLIQARSSLSQETVDFAVPIDRNDSIRPVKPYGDLSDG